MKDRPSNFGLPQRLVWGIGGADEVVLTNRPVDRKGVLGHIIGEGAVSSVDFGVGAEVDHRCGARKPFLVLLTRITQMLVSLIATAEAKPLPSMSASRVARDP